MAIMPTALEFLENHGKNILLSNGNRTATRVASYNQGIVVISQPLVPQLLVQVGPPCPLLVPSNSCSGRPRANLPGARPFQIEDSERQVP